MLNAQLPGHISLQTLLGRLREGRYVVPDFQRDFEWQPWDIRELISSIFRDYYIGSLLLWKGKPENFAALCCEPLYGQDASSAAEYIVLDGQQRLTAINYAFIAPDTTLPQRKNRALYFVRVDRFMDKAYDEAFDYEWYGPKLRRLIEDEQAQFERHIFPCLILGKTDWSLPNWVQGYIRYWSEQADALGAAGDEAGAVAARRHSGNAAEFGAHLQALSGQFQISFIELDSELDLPKVCNIFTQINSRGVQLDVFDLMNALLKPRNLQLRFMWRDASARLEFPDSKKMNVYVLQVMSILRQNYCSPQYLYYLIPGSERSVRSPAGERSKEIMVIDEADFRARWDEAVGALEGAISMLRHPQELGAIAPRFIPYVSILPAFAALQTHVRGLAPEDRLTAQRKVRHWYWASVYRSRYSGSVESTSARDFLEVKAWIQDDAAQPGFIGEFNSSIRSLDMRNLLKSGQSIYNAVFNLFVLAGARDWMTGNIPQPEDLDDHHIVPASWGKKHLAGRAVNTILNRTPLTSETNRHVIRDQLPNAYFPSLIEKHGRSTVLANLESHFISPKAFDILLRDPFTPDDFEAFITERQRTIEDAIENLIVKERLDLSLPMRELDQLIEQTERGLRAVIAGKLDDDPANLPDHIRPRINERLQREARKNPAFDEDRYRSLLNQLEFADLRELEGIIISKDGWAVFERDFANKDALLKKFGQLAELRNGIAHNRNVDAVTRKEGEAAIEWFSGVLKAAQGRMAFSPG